MSRARHPQTDGVFKVINRIVKNFLRYYYEYKQPSWDILLPAAECSNNSTRSEDLRAISFEIGLGWKTRNPTDLITGAKSRVGAVEEFTTKLEGAFDNARYVFDLPKTQQMAEAAQHFKYSSYKGGVKVWFSQKLVQDDYKKARSLANLSAGKFGPFIIKGLHGKNSIQLDLSLHTKIYNVFYVILIRPVLQKSIKVLEKVSKHLEYPEYDNNNEKLYRSQQILDHRRRWKGY